MSLAAGAACVALMVAAGWWPMRRLAPALVGPTWWERAAWATALGAALTGLAQVALSALGVAAGPWTPLTLALVSLLGSRAQARPAVAPRDARGAAEADARLGPWLAALLVAAGLVGTTAAVGTPFVADGSRIWGARARDLAREAAVDSPALKDAAREAVHRDYPLLAPALMAPAFALSPPDAVAGPKLVLAALQWSLLGLMASLLRREGTRGRQALAVFAAVPFLANAGVRESALAGGYVDGVVALFLLLVAVGLETMRRGGATGAGVITAGLCGAALASTKLEGGVELIVVLVAALVLWPRRAPVLAAAGLAVVLCAPTLALRAGVAPEPPGFDLAWLVDPDVLTARAVPVLAGVAGLWIDASSFALLPALLLAWLVSPGRGGDRRLRAFAWLLLSAMLGLMLVSYLSTTMHASRHVHTSAHRLLWHVLPALTWLVVRARGEAGDVAA